MVVVISYGPVVGCCYFLQLLNGCLNAFISQRLLGTMKICMPRELEATPRKRASDLQMPWHNLAQFCCAESSLSEFRLFLVSPSPISHAQQNAAMHTCSRPNCQTAALSHDSHLKSAVDLHWGPQKQWSPKAPKTTVPRGGRAWTTPCLPAALSSAKPKANRESEITGLRAALFRLLVSYPASQLTSPLLL